MVTLLKNFNQIPDDIEGDSFGEISVPDDVLYGAHTQRSVENFKISSHKISHEMIKSIASIKKACAKANNRLKLLDNKKAVSIVKACDFIVKGIRDENMDFFIENNEKALKKDNKTSIGKILKTNNDEKIFEKNNKTNIGKTIKKGNELNNEKTKIIKNFPIDIFQAGSGTSTNMNVNEVIANIASKISDEKIHPNDHVNMGQSTNNVFPTAIRISSLALAIGLLMEVKSIEKTFLKKSNEFKTILKAGRTHLQDAVPMTLGQEFHAYATALGKDRTRIEDSLKYLRIVGIGGNAIGTGINTHPRFRFLIVENLNKELKLNLEVTKDGIETTQFLTDIANLSSSLKMLAIDLNKICNDLRLLSSGPKTGFKEINLPAVEPGSSIMPGKINPSILEAVNMVSMQAIGNDTTITMAASQGNLELNTFMPIISHNIIESLEILKSGIKTMNEKCIQGITANREICTYYVENSASLATALNPHLGYDLTASLVKEALKTNKTIKQLIIEKKILSKEKVEKILNPSNLTKPNLKP